MAKALRMLCSLPQACAAVALLVSTATLSAATFTVTNTTDADIGSLRLAILDADISPGVDLIVFDIPGAGVHTISPTSPLPPISESVTIDGYTQPGSSPNTQLASDDAVLLIEIDGSASGPDADGLSVWHPDGDPVFNVTIRGLVVNRFDTNVILIGGGHRLEGCFIGTDPSGTLARSREGFSQGVYAAGSSTIGGALVSQRNVISGNNSAGIRGNGAIQGNFIGIDATGTASLANFVAVGDFSGVIGGPTAQAGTPPGNVISGNQGSGITFSPWRHRAVTIQGNLIGTDATGAAAIPNGGHGVAISRILPYWCNDYPPPRVCMTPGYAIVGGDDPVEANVIAYNLGDGIAISGGPEYLIKTDFRSNRIHSNAGLGIDRHNDGVTPNADGSPRNYPVLTAAASYGGFTMIQGTLNGLPNAAGIPIEFFSDAACDDSGYGEGATLIGSTTVNTDATGNASFWVLLPVSLELGSAVTGRGVSRGVSSEFSACRLVTDVFPLQVLDVTPGSGDAAGGTAVTVAGSGFLPGASLTIGGIPAENVVVVDIFRITATTPMLPPGTLNDVSVAGALDSATLSAGWMADFLDVPDEDIFHDDVETILRNGITAGCGDGYYCRNSPVRRDQMAVFLLKGLHGFDYEPPPCTPPGRFLDVACPGPFTDWVEQLAAEGITSGCGDGVYCPGNSVRRDQMAVFLLKAKHEPGFVPPACAGYFADVACPSTFADWIEQLVNEGITSGCGGGNYCPDLPSTRGQMAVFLVKSFELQ